MGRETWGDQGISWLKATEKEGALTCFSSSPHDLQQFNAGVKHIAHFSLQILHQLVLELIFGNYRQHFDLQFLREVS